MTLLLFWTQLGNAMWYIRSYYFSRRFAEKIVHVLFCAVHIPMLSFTTVELMYHCHSLLYCPGAETIIIIIERSSDILLLCIYPNNFVDAQTKHTKKIVCPDSLWRSYSISFQYYSLSLLEHIFKHHERKHFFNVNFWEEKTSTNRLIYDFSLINQSSTCHWIVWVWVVKENIQYKQRCNTPIGMWVHDKHHSGWSTSTMLQGNEWRLCCFRENDDGPDSRLLFD